MNVIDIPLARMMVLYLLLCIPLGVLFFLNMNILIRDTLISVLRMTVQLLLVGIFLKYIFQLNNPWLIGAWITVMIFVANTNIVNSAGLVLKRFFLVSLLSVATGTFVVAGFFIFMIIQPTPLYDARYVIPLFGMLLGNCLRGNILVLERFYSGIRKNEQEFLTYLLMGATVGEAIRPYMRDAIQAALKPTIATMMTIGIVSLPGMTTGQILGGSEPLTAIKYQIAIMIGIFVSLTFSAILTIILSLKVSFNSYSLLHEGIFKKR